MQWDFKKRPPSDVCSGFNVPHPRHGPPDHQKEVHEALAELASRMFDLEDILSQTKLLLAISDVRIASRSAGYVSSHSWHTCKVLNGYDRFVRLDAQQPHTIHQLPGMNSGINNRHVVYWFKDDKTTHVVSRCSHRLLAHASQPLVSEREDSHRAYLFVAEGAHVDEKHKTGTLYNKGVARSRWFIFLPTHEIVFFFVHMYAVGGLFVPFCVVEHMR